MINIGNVIDLLAIEFQHVERNVEVMEKEMYVADSIIEILRGYRDGSVVEEVELELAEGMKNTISK